MTEKEKSSTRMFLIAVILLIAVIGLLVFFQPITKFIFKPKIITIDDVHQKTLEGKESETNYVYNGFSFVFADGLWFTKIIVPGTGKEFNIPLHYGPRDLVDIPVTDGLKAYSTSYVTADKTFQIYITFDPDKEDLAHTGLAISELSQNLVSVLNIRIIPACTKNHSACIDSAIINCANTDKPVLYVLDEPGSEPGVELKENCITIKGDDFGLLKAVDRFLYQWYGIME